MSETATATSGGYSPALRPEPIWRSWANMGERLRLRISWPLRALIQAWKCSELKLGAEVWLRGHCESFSRS